MKLALILLLAATTFGQSIQDRVNKFEEPKRFEVEYDKFHKETSVSFGTTLNSSRPKYRQNLLLMVFAVIGDDGKARFSFLFDSNHTTLYNKERLSLLLDSKLLEIDDDEIGYTIIFALTDKHIEKIINAKSVELQLSIFECKLTDKDLTALKNLYSLTKPPPAH